MFLARVTIRWPTFLVDVVRSVRSAFAWVSSHALCGIPLDWPVRFVMLAVGYLVLRRWLSRRSAALVLVSVLLAKELFDVFVHQDLLSPRGPDLGDVADIISGLLGLAAAFAFEHLWCRRRATRSDGDYPSGPW